jgi:membrane-associated protease RseP (regulator of RpoE activity)
MVFPMRPWTSLPRRLLYFLAAVFCLITSLYASLWMYDARFAVNYPVEIGFNRSRVTTFDSSSSCISVYNVEHGSPADQAGLLPGDEIVGVNGILLTSLDPFEYYWTHSAPGDPVDLTVRRPGQSQPVNLRAIFRATNPDKPNEGILLASVRYLARFFPAFFLLVGFGVLFLRIDDPYAWLLSLLFVCFTGQQASKNVNEGGQGRRIAIPKPQNFKIFPST